MKYGFITETIEDCKQVLKWSASVGKAEIVVIALSLESFEYFKRNSSLKISCLHIWDIADMETIIDEAFVDAEQSFKEWMNLFSDREDSLFDVAVQHRFHIEFLNHAHVCLSVATLMATYFKESGLTYVVSAVHPVFAGPFFPNHHKNIRRSFLFKSISYEIFVRKNVSCRFIDKRSWFVLKAIPALLWFRVISRLLRDGAIFVVDRLRKRPTLERMFAAGPKHADVVWSGWGNDLSVYFLPSEVHRLSVESGYTSVHMVSRPQKLKEHNANFVKEHDNLFFHTPDEIHKAVSHGPRISLFPLSTLKRYVGSFLRSTIPHRFRALKNPSGMPSFKALLALKGFRCAMAFNVFIAYREAFFSKELSLAIAKRFNPAFFVGTDSANVACRAELAVMNARGVTTLSIPHGYKAYAVRPYDYLARFVLAPGSMSKSLAVSVGVPEEDAKIVGCREIGRKKIYDATKQKVKVVIATRSWGGMWSNMGVVQKEYDIQLRSLIEGLSKKASYETVVKSHPNGDYHEYYDLIVSGLGSPSVKHVSKGWKRDYFLDQCDVAVFLGDCPSFFVTALMSGIPCVFIKGTMSKSQKRMNYSFDRCAYVVDDVQQALEAIDSLASGTEFAHVALDKQNSRVDELRGAQAPEEVAMQLISKFSMPISNERSQKTDIALLLVATINIGNKALLKRNNTKERLLDYEQSLRLWLKQKSISKIVFVDNSAYSLDSLKKVAAEHNTLGKEVEFLSFNFVSPTDSNIALGELVSIDHALENSKLLSTCDSFVKMTGRVFVRNIDAIVKDLDAGFHMVSRLSENLTYVDSASVIFNKKFYLEMVSGFCKDELKRVIERGERTDIERLFAKALHRGVALDYRWFPYSHEPVLQGMSGTKNISYAKRHNAYRALKMHVFGRMFYRLTRTSWGESSGRRHLMDRWGIEK